LTPPPDGDLEPIRLILEEADLTGWIYTQGQRMTDILQSGEPFSFLQDDLTHWTEVIPDDTLLVVPPPHTSAPDQRLPRNQHRVLIGAGDYRVLGTAHLRPGEQDDPMLRATRRFLPLTDAIFGRGGGPGEAAEVVIVNLRRTSSFEVVEE
jgi:hypothetical protein